MNGSLIQNVSLDFSLLAKRLANNNCHCLLFIVPRVEIGSLERQLIVCTNANTVRKLLVKLAATNPTKPLWTVNPSWEIATPIKSLLLSMQRGFLQDFAYVLLGKARELTSKNVMA